MTDAEQEIDASRPVFSAEDERAMRRALELARLARPISPPNPSVGCVIMRAGEVLGEGFTQETGGPHAEVCAMRDAIARGHTLEGATAYVTLEPCSHYGRTPPCALALINAGFVRVVAAVLDPNPQVAGRGLRMLRDAGIKAECGLLEAEARAENVGFLTRMTRGTPWVRMKAAATLDGRTAFLDGRSQWITGPAAREDGHRYRSWSGAVLTGIGTVLADDPQMNVRLPDRPVETTRQPLRVVVDGRMKTPPSAKILHTPGGAVWIVTAKDDEGKRAALEAAGAKVVVLPDPNNPEHVDLAALMRMLGGAEVNEVHVEAGAGLNGALLDAGLVDELIIYQAPCFFGEGLPVAAVARPESPGAAPRWKTVSADVLADGDIRIICRRN